MKTLIILGHPRVDSYCGALARAYDRGAKSAAGVQTRFLAGLRMGVGTALFVTLNYMLWFVAVPMYWLS